MDWDEFTDLLAGLSADTPLGRMVMIRLETDREVIKNFSEDAKLENARWRHEQMMRAAKNKPQEEVDFIYKQLANAFKKKS